MAKRVKKTRSQHVEPPGSDCCLICDDVLYSHGKGKQYLQGVIGAIQVPAFPAVIGGYVAYIRLTNVYPKQKVHFALKFADNDEEIIGFDGDSHENTDPLGVHTLVVRIPFFTVDHPGRYIFCGMMDGVPFVQSPIIIASPPQLEQP